MQIFVELKKTLFVIFHILSLKLCLLQCLFLFSDGEKIMNAKAILGNQHLWKIFSEKETEMIITKSGR